MSAKHLIAAVATVVFTIASTALTATTAFAATADNAGATAAAASTGANVALAGAVLAGTKAEAEASHGLTRAEVIAQTLDARKKGLIPETEADFDVAQTRKHTAK